MKLYSIRDWDKVYENAATRQRMHTLLWMKLPLKHGKGFHRLIRLPNGGCMFGMFILIVEEAAKCPTRGILADSEGPLTAEDIADATGAKAEEVVAALQICSDPAYGIKWIIATDVDGLAEHIHAPPTPIQTPAQENTTDTTEKTEKEPPPSDPALTDKVKLINALMERSRGGILFAKAQETIVSVLRYHSAAKVEAAIATLPEGCKWWLLADALNKPVTGSEAAKYTAQSEARRDSERLAARQEQQRKAEVDNAAPPEKQAEVMASIKDVLAHARLPGKAREATV